MLAVETAKVRVRKAFDVPSANPVGVALQELIAATRTSCMAPCAVQFDAQKGASLTWAEVRDSEFLWDFDDGGSRTIRKASWLQRSTESGYVLPVGDGRWGDVERTNDHGARPNANSVCRHGLF